MARVSALDDERPSRRFFLITRRASAPRSRPSPEHPYPPPPPSPGGTPLPTSSSTSSSTLLLVASASSLPSRRHVHSATYLFSARAVSASALAPRSRPEASPREKRPSSSMNPPSPRRSPRKPPPLLVKHREDRANELLLARGFGRVQPRVPTGGLPPEPGELALGERARRGTSLLHERRELRVRHPSVRRGGSSPSSPLLSETRRTRNADRPPVPRWRAAAPIRRHAALEHRRRLVQHPVADHRLRPRVDAPVQLDAR